MKILIISSLLCISVKVSAQLNIKARFLYDGVYWVSSGDGNPKLARLKFDTITLYKFIKDMYFFKSNGIDYYTNEYMLYPSYQLDSLKKVHNAQSALIYERSAKQKDEKHKELIIKKYGNSIAKIINNHKVRIGMTKQMAIDSWGKPIHINTTTGIGYVHEQWVYGGNNYLYFENGVLTLI